MRTKNRKFIPEVYDKYDSIGKEALRKYLEKKGYLVDIEPYGLYDIDIYAAKEGKEIYLDSEVRPDWYRKEFPFKTIHIPKRKGKFLKYKDVFFCSIRNDLNVCLFIKGDYLKDTEIVQVVTKEIGDSEPFYNIPIKKEFYVNIRTD